MKIAFVVQPWTPLSVPFTGRDSIGIIVYELTKRLARRAEVTVHAHRAPGTAAEGTNAHGVRVRRFDFANRHVRIGEILWDALGSGGSLFHHPLFARRHTDRIVAAVAADRPDVVHVIEWHVPGLREALPDAALVFHAESDWVRLGNRARMARRMSEFDRVVACSRWTRERTAEHLPEIAGRVATVYNGVDETLFRPAGADDGETILFVGRLSPEKGVHVLIEAFGRVHRERPTARLRLVGPRVTLLRSSRAAVADPAIERALKHFYGRRPLDRLRRSVESHRLSYVAPHLAALDPAARAQVELVAPLPQSALAAHYEDAALLCYPSSWDEPFGMPVTEAMAAGRAVVATRSGGIVETVDHGTTGLLVPREDPRVLAEALLDLLGDPARRRAMGAAGRRRVEGGLTWDHAADELWRQYEIARGDRRADQAGLRSR